MKIPVLLWNINRLWSFYKQAGLVCAIKLCASYMVLNTTQGPIINYTDHSFSKDVTLKQKKQFIIWGCNDFSALLHTMMSEWGLEVVAFIDPEYNQQSFCNTPVMIYDRLHDTALPIIVANPHALHNGIPVTTHESIHGFFKTIRDIRNELKVTNELLHPCALIDFITVNCRGKILTFGLQGSGNVLYSHIIGRLHESHSEAFKPNNITLSVFEQLAYEYTQVTSHALETIRKKTGGSGLSLGSWYWGTGWCSMKADNENSLLYVLNNSSKNHLCLSSASSHQTLADDTVKQLYKQEYSMYLVLRNPLDSILSIYKKHALASGISLDDMLKDKERLAYLTTYIIDFLHSWLDKRPYIERLYYEDLINAPLEQIQKFAHSFDIDISDEEAEKIWNDLGFRQLPGATKGHFWKGGSGKWKEAFLDEQLACFKYFQFDDIIRQCGYPTVADELCAKWESINLDAYIEENQGIIDAVQAYRQSEEYVNSLSAQSALNSEDALSVALKIGAEDLTSTPNIGKIDDTHIVLASYDKAVFSQGYDVALQEPVKTVLCSGTHSSFQPG